MNQRYVSDELTHFVGRQLAAEDERYDLLVKILTTGWLKGGGMDEGEPVEGTVRFRYRWERKLSDPEGLFQASAVCFCDIPVADLSLHVRKYSRFALAFKKEFLIPKGAAPVFYVPRGSPLFGRTRAEILDEMGEELRQMHPPIPAGSREFRPPEPTRKDQFLERFVLSYVKPFDETKAEDDPDNYYMEREWRILSSVRFRLADVWRVILPEVYGERFRENVPMYKRQVAFVE